MSNRIFRFLAVFFVAFAVLSCVACAGGTPRSALETFLSELNVGKAVREKLLTAIGGYDTEKERAVIVRAEDGGMFCLAVVRVPGDRDADVAAEMETLSQERALSLARGRLALVIGQGKVDRKIYRYDDALGSALFTYYGPRGIETAADLLSGGKTGKFAAALAWLSPKNVEELTGEALPPKILDVEYCRSLYLDNARDMFKAGRYSDALPLFKNIHDLRWMDISAYLDAAECFLRTGEPKECLKLLKELRAALDAEMNSEELARSGRLCREAGDRNAALSAFRQARKRFHEELAYHGK